MDYSSVGPKCDRVRSAERSPENAELIECTYGKAENLVKRK